ncbi:hypothetical protein F2Q70_00005745 [Brassica cretica]|uniref:Pentacotripeptide-repeat region of PRORP domain-containing protein n=1 Tax=Brassica cretica TaxID=69181 RepID=A0A8S9IPS4_BRACR|nr:hypothetical protein F2Q70_00005745 [Brassica cretica]
MFHELDQVLLQLKSDTIIVPTEILFCNVNNYFGRGRLATRALHLFDEMPQYRCQHTVKSVNSLLNALLKCGAFNKMKEVLSSIDKYGKPEACIYNILINGYSQSGCFDDALKLFDEMVKKKVKPTGVTFGTLIHGLCKNFKIGELSLAFKLKEESYEGKIKVDSAIYSTLISSLIKAGRSDEVSGILEEMREKGCEPDTVSYNGVKPDVISYNMILSAVFRIKNWKEGAYLFEDMPRRGCVPDILSYRIVFDGLCEGSQFEEVAVVLDEMMFKGYKPRRDRLEIFLQRLCESGKWEILGKVISSLSKGNAVDADWSFISNAALLDHFSCKVSVAVLVGQNGLSADT